MLVEYLIKVEKWHSAKKIKKNKISTFATFPTTLSDNFQKNSTSFFELFSVGPAMNLRVVTVLVPGAGQC